MTAFLPCPFCGSSSLDATCRETESSGRVFYYVGIRGSHAHHATKGDKVMSTTTETTLKCERKVTHLWRVPEVLKKNSSNPTELRGEMEDVR